MTPLRQAARECCGEQLGFWVTRLGAPTAWCWDTKRPVPGYGGRTPQSSTVPESQGRCQAVAIGLMVGTARAPGTVLKSPRAGAATSPAIELSDSLVSPGTVAATTLAASS
jgi:hypothetical protein